MIIELKKGETPEEMRSKLAAFSVEKAAERKKRLEKLFGSIKLAEDPVVLQRKWRDEW